MIFIRKRKANRVDKVKFKLKRMFNFQMSILARFWPSDFFHRSNWSTNSSRLNKMQRSRIDSNHQPKRHMLPPIALQRKVAEREPIRKMQKRGNHCFWTLDIFISQLKSTHEFFTPFILLMRSQPTINANKPTGLSTL